MEPKFENPQKNEEFPELKSQLIDYINGASVKQLMDAEKALEIRLEPKDDSTEAFKASFIEAINNMKTRKEAENLFEKLMPDQEMKKEQE